MSFPLISHAHTSAPFAYYQGRIVTAGEYLDDVYAMAEAFPAGQHVLNLCHNRYRFLVGLGASIIKGATSLLPSSITTEVLHQLRDFAPDFFLISDHRPSFEHEDFFDPSIFIKSGHTEFAIPEISDDQVIAYVFTSGSTGLPIPHSKKWGSLVKNIQLGKNALHIQAEASVVGTTPSQHMYGFESNIFLCLHGSAILYDEKPFFPADIAQALESIKPPRVLVTTPYHLDKLVESEVTLPQIDRIVCATAPLSVGLAIRAEATYRCELLEIFGSTETGQIAYRRTTQSNDWQLMGDLVISSHDQGFAVRGEHLPNFVHLTDIIEIKGAHSFELIGRSQDMVNIAGKRSSLTYLNTILRSIPGLREGVFFSPSTSATDQNRLALIYVSDTLTEEVLRKALRQFIEPVFLPRPMIKVEEIPRNPTGKVLQNALDLLVRSKLSHGA